MWKTGHYYDVIQHTRGIIQLSNNQEASGTKSRFTIMTTTENGNQVICLDYLEKEKKKHSVPGHLQQPRLCGSLTGKANFN